MNHDDRIVLRARQLLDDPTLKQNERITNAEALLRQLAANLAGDSDRFEDMLNEISDLTVRDQMRAAIVALNG